MAVKPETAKLICLVCKKRFVHLGSHIWHKHKMLARDYKSRFSLPYSLGLVSEQVRAKQARANFRHRNKNRRNLVAGGEKYRFKKGRTGQRRISEYERRRILERILNVNARKSKMLEQCPVCNIKFKNMQSHLYRAHKLISVANLKSYKSYPLETPKRRGNYVYAG